MPPQLIASDAALPRKRHLEPLDLVILGIVLLAAVPRLYLGATQFIEYDGYWHIFTAQQDSWHNFIWDCRNDAHPPLYYLALRLTLWLGRSHLAYRAISIVAGLATIAALGRIASKTMRSALTPALVALAYGLALPAIVISCEVRSYMLCSLFLLIAYTYFLDAIDRTEPAGGLRPRIFFAVAATLACPTDYYAVFFVCAMAGLAAVLPILRRSEPLWKAWAREAATFAPVFGSMAWLYFWHLRKHPVLQQHLLPYYYDRQGAESLGGFLLRNLQSTFDLFSPWPAAGRTAFLAIAGGLLAALVGSLWLLRRIWAPKNLAAVVTLVATVLMLAQIMAASLVRLYPFGGFMRQQFLLFPFLVLCAFLLPDRLLTAIPRGAAWALAGVLSLTIAAVSYREFHAFPKVREKLMTQQMRTFALDFPSPPAIYVDQFNVIGFFLQHDDWKWRFAGRVPSAPDVDLYGVSRGDRQTLVFRDKDRWVVDFRDARLYPNLAACLRSRGLPAIAVFRLGQSEEAGEAAELSSYREAVADLASANGLCLEALRVHDRDIFAEFRAEGCSAPPSP
jgi:hypothetical protein